MNCSHTTGGSTNRIDVGEPHPLPHNCAATVQQLVDVAVKGSLAFTSAALKCCAAQKNCAPVSDCGCGSTGSASAAAAPAAPTVKRTVESDDFATERVDVHRQLTLDTPLSNGYHSVPHDRITLLPNAGRDPQSKPLGALKPTAKTFRISVDATGLPGSVYFADVRVSSSDGKPDKIVKVFIEL
ncbi:hypothetical protein [Mycolicibacterium celeriflavum]|uniref:hypothetical protein n=1 Tax=Mycolicibacterium celeriflavum TaxID=1249101 RepID=UPI003CF7092B